MPNQTPASTSDARKRQAEKDQDVTVVSRQEFCQILDKLDEADLPPSLPDTSGWVRRLPGDVIEAGTPYVFISTSQSVSVGTIRRNYKLDKHVPGTYWTPPPVEPAPWERISTDREWPTLAKVTWTNAKDGVRRSQTAKVYVSSTYVYDEWDHPVGLTKHVTSVELLHTHNPETHIPVERALIERIVDGGGVTYTDLRALAALADGAQS